MRIIEVVEQKKIASFALGRMNPATIGHELLVNAIKAQPGDHFLFLTDRAPKLPDNPLTPEQKLDWARKSFNGIAIGLAKTVLTAADRLYKMGYTEVTFLEGEDKLYKLLTQYNGVEKEMHNFNFDKIGYVRLSRNAGADDATGMSGTKLRNYVKENNFEAFKKGITKAAQPYAEEMYKELQGALGVDPVESINEATRPPVAQKIKPIKMSNPPKAPDSTIPRTRDGYTTKDGTTYKQDKYDENIMHVSNGGGTYTFDGSRLIKWTTPKIQGYRQIHDFVQKTIKVDSDTTVKPPEGADVVISTKAVYDLEGNLQNGGELGISLGGLGVGLSDKQLSINYVVSDNLSIHTKAPRNTKIDPKTQKQLAQMVAKTQSGNVSQGNLLTMAKLFRKAGASFTFKSPANGPAIPFNQGVEMLRQAGE